MRIHCVLEKDRYDVKVFNDEIRMQTKVQITIDDEDLYDGFTKVADVIVVLEEDEDEDEDGR